MLKDKQDTLFGQIFCLMLHTQALENKIKLS